MVSARPWGRSQAPKLQRQDPHWGSLAPDLHSAQIRGLRSPGQAGAVPWREGRPGPSTRLVPTGIPKVESRGRQGSAAARTGSDLRPAVLHQLRPGRSHSPRATCPPPHPATPRRLETSSPLTSLEGPHYGLPPGAPWAGKPARTRTGLKGFPEEKEGPGVGAEDSYEAVEEGREPAGFPPPHQKEQPGTRGTPLCLETTTLSLPPPQARPAPQPRSHAPRAPTGVVRVLPARVRLAVHQN